MEACSLGDELHEDGDRAVGLRRRFGEESVGDLSLHHHTPKVDLRQTVEALGDQRRRDVVGKVRNELCRVRGSRSEIDLQRIGEPELDIRPAREAFDQLRTERGVDLDGVDLPHAIRQERRQDAETWPDLQHDVVLVKVGETADDAQDVLVDEEVLPELLLGANGHENPNKARAFASICRPSSAGSSPRVSASTATVCTTYAGSFVLPRTGCGARYGQSVSARIRFFGTWTAASRRSDAFGYVTFPANDT